MSRKVKRLPKEVQAMFDGGTALLQIAIALISAIVKKGGTAQQIHALAKPEGKATIERMVDAFFGAVQVVAGHFKVTYNQSLGLIPLIHRAVGSGNIGTVNTDITQERFPLAGTGVRTLNLRVEPFLDGETTEEAAVRLVKAGHILRNTGDLAAFLHDHPGEVAKWAWVLAIGEDSRWTNPYGSVCVPCANVLGADRYFRLLVLRRRLNSYYGALVSSESET